MAMTSIANSVKYSESVNFAVSIKCLFYVFLFVILWIIIIILLCETCNNAVPPFWFSTSCHWFPDLYL